MDQQDNNTAPDNNTDPVAETTTEKKGPSEADIATDNYINKLPEIFTFAKTLSQRQLFRVLANFVQFPLIEHEKPFISKKEEALFVALVQIEKDKHVILKAKKELIQQAEIEATLVASKDIQGEE